MAKINIKRRMKRKKKDLNSRVAKVEKQLISQSEIKFVSGNYTGTASALAPVILNLAPIAEGTGDLQRIGHKVQAKSIELNIYITNNTATPSNTYRYVLFYSKVATPNADELLFAGSTNGWKAFRNTDHLQQYRVLRDKKAVKNSIVYWDSFTNTVQYPNTQKYHHEYKSINVPLNFNGPLSTANSGNSLSLMIFSAEGVPNAVIYSVEYKLRFVDA